MGCHGPRGPSPAGLLPLDPRPPPHVPGCVAKQAAHRCRWVVVAPWQAGALGAALTQGVRAGEVGGGRGRCPWSCLGDMKPTPHGRKERAVADFQGASLEAGRWVEAASFPGLAEGPTPDGTWNPLPSSLLSPEAGHLPGRERMAPFLAKPRCQAPAKNSGTSGSAGLSPSLLAGIRRGTGAPALGCSEPPHSPQGRAS